MRNNLRAESSGELATARQGNRFVERPLPSARNQANRSSPACVNFTKVPDSCLTNQPFSIARSMPARY